MKLRILSDLHIEFHPFVIPSLAQDKETVLILAGDIGVVHRRSELQSFLEAAAAQFRAVFYVPGNHEYYAGLWPDAAQHMAQWGLPDTVHVADCDTVVIDDVAFVGATLWSDFDGADPFSMHKAEQLLNDFRYIRVQPSCGGDARSLTASDVLAHHRHSLQWLESELAQQHRAGRKTVLVTHHGFSRRSVHPTYEGNDLNGAFVSDCDDLVSDAAPALAIHGHVHNSFQYTMESRNGPVPVIVNPRGYTRRDDTQENPLFDPLLGVTL